MKTLVLCRTAAEAHQTRVLRPGVLTTYLGGILVSCRADVVEVPPPFGDWTPTMLARWTDWVTTRAPLYLRPGGKIIQIDDPVIGPFTITRHPG